MSEQVELIEWRTDRHRRAGAGMSGDERLTDEARHEIEDLWWLRHCLESMTESRDTNSMVRIGVLRALLKTTEPETSTTDPRRQA